MDRSRGSHNFTLLYFSKVLMLLLLLLVIYWEQLLLESTANGTAISHSVHAHSSLVQFLTCYLLTEDRQKTLTPLLFSSLTTDPQTHSPVESPQPCNSTRSIRLVELWLAANDNLSTEICSLTESGLSLSWSRTLRTFPDSRRNTGEEERERQTTTHERG